MKKIPEAISTVVMVFLLSWLINSISDYYFKPKISAMFGSILEFKGNNFLPLDITNYGKKMVNEIRISIPKNTNVYNILSSNPIKIKEFENDIRNIEIKRLEISGIEANQMTRLYIPLPDKNSAHLCNILNIKDKNLEIIPIKDLKSPLKKSVKDALYSAILIALLLGLFYWKTISKVENLEERLERVQVKLEEAKDEEERKLKETKQDLMRMKILLLARLSDYSKELTFWRDTIRKILYSTSKAGKKVAEEVIKEVTATLKTHSTLSESEVDFETIKMASLLLEKKSKS